MLKSSYTTLRDFCKIFQNWKLLHLSEILLWVRPKYLNLIKIKFFLFHEVHREWSKVQIRLDNNTPYMMPSRILVMVPYRIFCHCKLRIEKLHAAFIIIAQIIEFAVEIAL